MQSKGLDDHATPVEKHTPQIEAADFKTQDLKHPPAPKRRLDAALHTWRENTTTPLDEKPASNSRSAPLLHLLKI
jgi:hypothetical protein